MVNHTCGPFIMMFTLVVVFVESYVLAEQTKKKVADSLMLPSVVTFLTALLLLLEGILDLRITNLPLLKQIYQQGAGGAMLVEFIIFSIVTVALAMLVKKQLKLKLDCKKTAQVFVIGSAAWTLLGYFVQHGGWCTF